jgi:hypothetical protein
MKENLDSFFDLRPHLSEYLAQRVSAMKDGYRHNMALLGPVGSGKSCLISTVLQKSPKEKIIKVYFSLQKEPAKAFLKRFIVSIIKAGLELEVDEPYELLIQGAKERIPKTYAAIQELETYIGGRLQVDAFVRALDLVPTLQQELNRPCVLVFDEFYILRAWVCRTPSMSLASAL